MSTTQHSQARRDVPIALAVLGLALLLAAIPLGPRATMTAVVANLALVGIALRETRTPVVTWPNTVGLLVGVIWLIPIKGYALPVDLPFNLEHYRLLLVLLVVALGIAVLVEQVRLTTAGALGPIVLLGVGSIVSMALNMGAIDAATGETGTAVKSFSYFVAFLVVYVLVCSVLVSQRSLDTVARALVLGGTVVAIAALYEARVGYNPFDHLHEWLPGFERQFREVLEERAGRVRVYASAQHPIALGVALLLVAPLALYLSTRARSIGRSRLWVASGVTLVVGATATISRTTVVMATVMGVTAFLLRRRQVTRYWPLLLLLPVVIHLAAPGAMGGLYKSFFPERGLVADLQGRSGEGGSGRLADVTPAIDIWLEQPVFGQGLGNEFPATDVSMTPGQAAAPLIFDNQYLDTLTRLGLFGIVGLIWLVWGGGIRLFRAARRTTGPPSDLLVACSVATLGFGAALLFYDGVAFVQSAIVFIVILALGSRAALLPAAIATPAEANRRGGHA
jgi:hypothetical protein